MSRGFTQLKSQGFCVTPSFETHSSYLETNSVAILNSESDNDVEICGLNL